MTRELEPALDDARARLAAFVGASADDLVFVANATSAVNAVVRSQCWAAGDEILVTDHGYNACSNAVRFAADRCGATVVVAPVPFPLTSPDDVVAAVVARVTTRTRFVLLDHITSPTGVVFPVDRLCVELAARGVDVMVDGAHAPGMIPLDVPAVGATYYTGNLHKWVCAPKGAAFLWVAPDRHDGVRPTVISHGANSGRTDRSRLHLEFDWPGTIDPTPWLCVPVALDVVGGLLPGGWPALMDANHALAVAARDVLATALGVAPPVPDGMLGALAALPLPDGDGSRSPGDAFDPLQDLLWHEHRIEVPVISWPRPPHRLVRVSCQRYNHLADYERLAAVLRGALARQ